MWKIRFASLPILLIGFLLTVLPLRAQQEGIWNALLAIHRTEKAVETPKKIFAMANGVLYSVDKEEPYEVKIFDRISGLSDVSILEIAYAEQLRSLVIYYASGNIDILTETGAVINVSALQDNIDLIDKTLNRLLVVGDKAYLAGGFGLSVLDVAEGRILATYAKGTNVVDVAKLPDSQLLMFHSGKLYIGKETDNLQDPSTWRTYPLSIPTTYMSSIGSVGDDICFLLSDGQVFAAPALSPVATYLFSVAAGSTMEIAPRGLFICAADRIHFIDRGRQVTTFQIANVLDAGAMADSQTAYLAMGEDGLAALPLSEGSTSTSLPVAFDGPGDNNYYEMLFQHGRLYAASGLWGTNLMWYPGMVKVYDGKKWTNYDKKTVEETIGGGFGFNDAVDIAVTAADPDHFFVGTWGRGLFEFKGGQPVARYSAGNTAIAECNPGDARVKGIAFDAKGNLWGTLGSVLNNIFMYEIESNQWHAFSYPEVSYLASFGNMVILPNGDKWVNILHRSGGSSQRGMLIFNDQGTPASTSDDKYRYVEQFVNRLGAPLGHKIIYALAIDHNGTMWMGSDIGIFGVHNAASVLSSTSSAPVAVRPVGGAEPNLYYILDKVTVTDIVVDKLNNKWVGTQGNGLYLLSEDCSRILAHYAVSNSPLLSDNILSLALDGTDGLLYIGTADGLMTFQTGTGSGTVAELDGIYVYPNPLRPEHPDGITIAGLQAGCDIKITDMTGRLLFQTESVATEVKWNARGADGNRVASGVYAVAVYDPASKKSKLLRFAVIH
ncbi:type IX secretion system anionic LPS delivery protein PorZ [Porphyromonas loveana]|uniref:type IX secretion system anionic LPS delivery protein PorZ n=1 Tax=Porphyromonas loveana TaxID=1884669 RepID=UPI0035A18DA7